jgi:telomere length regulation protein
MQSSDSRSQIQNIFERLRAQVSDLQTLLNLLTAPLDSLDLLPPQYRHHNVEPISSGTLNIKKHIPQLQRVLLQSIVPTWDTLLAENNATLLLDQYFCPDSFSNALPAAGEIAILAYSTLVSSQMTEYVLRLLERLSVEYPVDRLHAAAFPCVKLDKGFRDVEWEDCVRDFCMVPDKVANSLGATRDIPLGLENGVYFNNLTVRCEQLIFTLSAKSSKGITVFYFPALINSIAPKDVVPSITYLLTKLVNVGIFPPSLPIARSQLSFFHTSLPSIRRRLKSDNSKPYSDYWSAVILAIPSSHTLQSILTCIFASLLVIEPSTDTAPTSRACVKQEASLLNGLIGLITPDIPELWEIGTSLLTSRDWPESHARIFICWFSGGSQSTRVSLKGSSFSSLKMIVTTNRFLSSP